MCAAGTGRPISRCPVVEFCDEDIRGIGVIAAFFALSARMANLVDRRPSVEFCLHGRVPKSS